MVLYPEKLTYGWTSFRGAGHGYCWRIAETNEGAAASVNGYLMDTNHVTAWEGRNAALISRLDALPKNTLVYACVITLGEIEAGHEMTSGDLQRRHQVRQFLNLNVIPDALNITLYTRWYYG